MNTKTVKFTKHILDVMWNYCNSDIANQFTISCKVQD